MKTIASAEKIRAEIQRRISSSAWGKGYCADCPAPYPYRISDDGIANWTTDVAASAKSGCEGFLLDIIASMRRDYDLPPESLGELTARLLAWRKQP